MSNEIKVYPLKSKVKFGEDLTLKGEITAITLRDSCIVYEISFWKGDDIKSIWLNESHFKTVKATKQRIGFENEIP